MAITDNRSFGIMGPYGEPSTIGVSQATWTLTGPAPLRVPLDPHPAPSVYSVLCYDPVQRLWGPTVIQAHQLVVRDATVLFQEVSAVVQSQGDEFYDYRTIATFAPGMWAHVRRIEPTTAQRTSQ